MKVMISLPMDGHSDEDVRKRMEFLKKEFGKLHIDVMDSFIDVPADESVRNEHIFYLGRSIMMFLAHADAVYFDNGWNNARGCRIENQICKEYGIKCLYSGFFNDVDSIATPGGSIHINTPGILKSNEYPKVTYRSSVDDNSLIDASNNHVFGVDIN